jgi:hypothetical protein
MVELEENVMIMLLFANAYLVEMICDLGESGYFKGEDVVAFYTTEDQEGVDFDDYELSNMMENALP